LPSVELIQERLRQVFPEGVEHRAPAVAERAAKSLYVFLYTFAVEGVTEHRVRPKMVTTMSDAQAARRSVDERRVWWESARRARAPGPIGKPWYADNSREPIRDETFRVWKEYGALLEDPLPVTSSLPRYRLEREFADLFDPDTPDERFIAASETWQARHLPAAARARIALLQQQTTPETGAVVQFPDGVSRALSLGPSTPLLKAAVEHFAATFLHQPVVLIVTESRQRLAYEDAAQLRRLRITPDPRVMPDLLLADVAPRTEDCDSYSSNAWLRPAP
jgi:hypothetical protein